MNLKIKRNVVAFFAVLVLQLLSGCVPYPVYSYNSGYYGSYNNPYSYNTYPYGAYYTPSYSLGYYGHGLRGFYGPRPGFGLGFYGHRHYNGGRFHGGRPHHGGGHRGFR